MNLNEVPELKKLIDELDQIILKGGSPGSSAKFNITEETLTRDPNLRYLSNGTAVCDFGVGMGDPHSIILSRGVIIENNFCIAYDQTAEIINRYYRKGSEIDIAGNIWHNKILRQVREKNVWYDQSIFVVNEVPLPKIQQICYERDIKTLCHFTRIERLRSVLHRDLLSRKFLEKLPRKIRPPFTDQDRGDGYKDAICLSISFPNYRMFFKKNKWRC